MIFEKFRENFRSALMIQSQSPGQWNEAKREACRELPTGLDDCSRWFATATGSNLLAWRAGSTAKDEESRIKIGRANRIRSTIVTVTLIQSTSKIYWILSIFSPISKRKKMFIFLDHIFSKYIYDLSFRHF